MRLTLAALNAQYMHTNLAVRSIAAYLAKNGEPTPHILECTINQQPGAVLEQLYSAHTDVYLFSCYIWNVHMVCALAHELHKLLPNALLAVGGPQVSYHCKTFLRNNPCFSVLIAGEGEQACLHLAQTLAAGAPLQSCPGLWLRQEDQILQTAPLCVPHMDTLPFPYTNLPVLKNRILYYESMRGCPFGCSYCLSSVEKGVRFKSPALVCAELQHFLDAGVRQVKFVDRTFNCNPAHALHIWRYLAAHDNGHTNFHFELAGELLTEEMTTLLATLREGLFQFEIGVQSTNPATLAEISRPANLPLLFQNIRTLQAPHNIHLHLDLIAGLPLEDFTGFIRSFNEVYALAPAQLQLGFLKVLGGSGMEEKSDDYGLVWQSEAPFELLFTKWISYEELAVLRGVASMVEQTYNSARFTHLMRYLLPYFANPFALYRTLAAFYKQSGHGDAPVGKIGQYELLGKFMQAQGIPTDETPQWLCRYDLALHEKIKALPSWVTVDGARPHRKQVLAFYETPGNVQMHLPALEGRPAKQLLKMAHIEVFPFDPASGKSGECAILFDYTRRDLLGRAHQRRISLPKSASGS